jgi:hypothetical protein
MDGKARKSFSRHAFNARRDIDEDIAGTMVYGVLNSQIVTFF